MQELPARLGYRMPAEWEPHEATWLAWPHNRHDWPGKFGPIPWVYAEIVRLLCRAEPVNVLVKGSGMERRAADLLDRAGADLTRVTFVKARTDRVWTRDTGPTFVVNDRAERPEDRVGLIDWMFNGWAKYADHKRDNRIPRKLARRLGLRRWKPRVAVGGGPSRGGMEGGQVDVNGRGTPLTTAERQLSGVQADNPGPERGGVWEAIAD